MANYSHFKKTDVEKRISDALKLNSVISLGELYKTATEMGGVSPDSPARFFVHTQPNFFSHTSALDNDVLVLVLGVKETFINLPINGPGSGSRREELLTIKILPAGKETFMWLFL